MTDDTATALELAEIRRWLADGTARRIREAANLSQCDVARDLGVAASLVSRWEIGQHRPRADVALRYGRLLRELEKQTAGHGSPLPEQ